MFENILSAAKLEEIKKSYNMKTGVIIGLVLGWVFTGPDCSCMMSNASNNPTFCVAVLIGLIATIIMQAFDKTAHYLDILSWPYVSSLILLLNFIRVFYYDYNYLTISSFLLGLCVVYLLYQISKRFFFSEEPVYLVSFSLVTAYVIYILTDIYLSFFPEKNHLIYLILSLSVLLLFRANENKNEDSWAKAISLRPPTGNTLKNLLLCFLCLLTVFLIYTQSAISFNHLDYNNYNYWLYISIHALYAIGIVVFALLIKAFKPFYIFGYCLSIVGCAVAIEMIPLNSPIGIYTSLILFALCTAGIDIFTILFFVSLSREGGQIAYVFIGLAMYGLILEFSEFMGICLSNNPTFTNNYLFAFIIIVYILLALPLVFMNRIPSTEPESEQNSSNLMAEGSTYEDKLIDSFNLTPAETKVYQLICQGLSNADIADSLQVSLNTVKYHARNILHKAGVKNRRELLALLYNDSLGINKTDP